MAGTQTESALTLSYHGGNLDAARRIFPHAPQPWIDLSTGINVCAYPVAEVSLAAWTRLPQAGAVSQLERTAARAFGVSGDAQVVAAPGTQSLIQWLPHLLPLKFIGILGFTYGEYARVWHETGASVTHVETRDELADFNLAIIVNPNNPDGRFVEVADLAALSARLQQRGGWLLVDEAFVDFYEKKCSFAQNLPENVLVFRSFGKAYGLAGVRLGFVIAAPKLADQFRHALGPWAVSGPAIEIATAALADEEWRAREAGRLSLARAQLENLLAEAGFETVGGTHLFVLARHVAAQMWFERLGQAGILVRPFAQKPQWLRFGIPAPQDWPRLRAALARQT